MKIAPLLQIVNQNASTIKTSLNSETLSFSDFLVINQKVKQLPSMGKHVESSKSLTFHNISDELTHFLENLSLDQVEIKSRLHIDDEADGTGSTMISLLENEINESLSQANSIDELIEKTMSSSSTVAVLSLVKVIEDISNEQNVDFTPFISKLNHLLELEFPSYSNKDTVQFTSMVQAIDQMEPRDKALVEGQLLLANWTEGKDTTRILNLEKLLIINNRITEAKRMPMQEIIVKNEILNEIFAFSSEEKLDSRMEDFFWEIDFTTLQLIINKTVKSIFNDAIIEPQVNNFVIQDQFMSIDSTEISNDNRLLNDLQNESKNQSWITQNNQVENEENNEISVIKTRKENIEDREYTPSFKTFEATIQDQFMSIDSTEISNDNRLLNDLQNESKNQSWITQNNQVENEENNEISVVKTCKENIEDREYTPSAKTFEATINLLYSELNQLSETSGIDLSHILKEFVSLLNQYTSSNEDSKQLEKNVRNDFTNNMNIIEQVQMGRETSIDRTYTHLYRIQEPFDLKTDRLKSKISLETALPFDRIFEQRKATPIIDNIMEISKTVDDVADELSVDVNEVFPEIEKIGYDFLNLPSLNRNDQQISNGIVRNEVIRQIVPLMKSVRQFIKGVELLSTEKSIELTEIFSKVENSLQTELFKFALEGQKVTLIDDVPHLYEFLVSNLSKQDGKLKGKISEQLSAANETVTPKINNPFASQILTENPIESLNQQRIKMTYSQFQSRELTKKVEGNEERFTIQIDKFITNQTGTPLEFTKTELPTRQEFTNQLLNVFKTSKFAQLPNGANRLVIKLNPDHLGSLTVKLVQKNGEMIARIMASTESAKELLDHSVHQLKQVLPSVQIEIERFEIFTEPFSRELRGQSNHKDKNEKEHEATDHEDEQENEKSFIDSLNEVFNITV